MKQYYIGQPIVHLNRFWKVIRIGSDKVEIKSCKSNDKGFHRITTLIFNNTPYKNIPTTDTGWEAFIAL